MSRAAEAKQQALIAMREAREATRRARAPKMVDMPDPTGDAVKDAEVELTELQRGFRERAKAENERFELATDSEFWCCLCFQSRDQKNAFIAALNLILIGDKYLDGQEVARVLGVKLPAADVPYLPEPRIDRALASLAVKKED